MLPTRAADQVPLLVILGADDDIVDARSTADFFDDAQVHTIDNVDHFFSGADGEIQKVVSEFMNGA